MGLCIGDGGGGAGFEKGGGRVMIAFSVVKYELVLRALGFNLLKPPEANDSPGIFIQVNE